MSSSLQFKLKAKQVVYITLFWVIASMVGILYDFFTIYSTVFEIGIENYDPLLTLKVTVITVSVAGVVGGGTYVFFLQNRFNKVPFTVATVIISLIIIIIIIALGVFASFVYNGIMLGQSMLSPGVVKEVGMYLKSSLLWQNTVMWFIVTSATIFVLQVRDRYGQGMLLRSLTGRYHHPVEEDRVFMFLDLKSSTAIAENLGHINYFSFLSDFFKDVTDPVILTKAEIYQYVGDEIVITWKIKNGFRHDNAVRCFFLMKEKIEKRKDYYCDRYGYIPTFKAGIHCGPVTSGEIGVVKRDVVYSGDVMNTTSRIQEACNQFGVELLVSDHLHKAMKLNERYRTKEIGGIILRGKQAKVSLFSVQE
jgi:adenylate cyclase